MDEERAVHPDCRNTSNQYHECSEYCFRIIAEEKIRMNKGDTGNILSFFKEIKKSMTRIVHPDCRNASNPCHECSEYCFKIIDEAEIRMDKNDTGYILSLFKEIKTCMARIVYSDCRNASNPYHECSEYCFEIIAEAKIRMDKSDTGNILSQFKEIKKCMARIVLPDCKNASNPYHESSEYCFKIIAEAKIRMNKSDIGNILSLFKEIKKSTARIVHPDCRNASNPYHECNEYCFKIIAEAKTRMNKSDTGNIL